MSTSDHPTGTEPSTNAMAGTPFIRAFQDPVPIGHSLQSTSNQIEPGVLPLGNTMPASMEPQPQPMLLHSTY